MLIFLLSTARAGDVLLPEFSAGSFSDFEAAEQLTAQIDDALTARRISLDGPDVIFAQAEDLAVGCAEEAGCPAALLERMPARLAVIGKVSAQGGAFEAEVSFYAASDPSPIEKIARALPASAFADFSDEVAATVESLLPLIPPLPGASAEPLAVEPDIAPPEPELAAAEPPRPDPVVVAPEELDPPTIDDPRIASLPRQAQEHFLASRMSAEDWLVDRRVRVGQLTLDLHGAAAFGDVNRRFDTRVSVSTNSNGELAQEPPYEYEDFIQGTGQIGGISIGYVPVWWLQTEIFGGVMQATKELTTGWEQLENDVLVAEDSVVYEPTPALLGVIEPRLRLLFVATGPIKPYALGGLHLRIYDGYDVPDISGKVNYANRPGGLGAGVTGGAGLAIDSRGKTSAFLEVPWSLLFSPPSHYQEGEALLSVPDQAMGSGQMLMVRGGIGVRL